MSSLPSARVLLALHPLLLLLLLGARPGESAHNHWTSRQTEEPFCYPFNETCGPITPAVPSSYEANMEHTDVVNNVTHYIEEFYDYEADSLAVTDSWAGFYTHTIFYYAMNRAVFMWTERGVEAGITPTTCTVFEISHKSWVNPFPGQDNTTHLSVAPSQTLLFGGDYRYSWMENNTQRGMFCNRWDACITNDLGTFYVEYEWSIPTRVVEFPQYSTERPVRMRMTGQVQPLEGTTEPIFVDSIFTLGLFRDNPEARSISWAFEIPSGVYCEGLPAGKSPPDAMAVDFSMRVELTMQTSASPRQEYRSTVKSWYDHYHKLTRHDSITNPGTVEFEAVGLLQVAVIRDFSAGVEYVVDKALGNCTTMELTAGYDTIATPDGSYAMKDPLLMFGLEGANLTYHGTKYARGLPCDVWVGHFDFEIDNDTIHDAYLYEVYMLQAGWTEETGEVTDKPVPILIKVFQDITVGELPVNIIENLEENIFKFKEEEVIFTVFDITPCFIGHDHIRRFQMAFPSKYRQYYDEQPAKFTSWVHNGLYIDLSIPAIRVQQLEIEFVESYDRLFCEFTLVDVPQVDMELPPNVGKPLDEVVELLENSMDSLTIVILDDDNKPLLMKPYSDSLREMFQEGCYSRDAPSPPLPNMDDHHSALLNIYSPRHSWGVGDGDGENLGLVDSAAWAEMQQVTRSNDEKIYSPGDMAGMAVGMLVLGLLLGTVVMLALLKKMGFSSDIELIPMNSRRQ